MKVAPTGALPALLGGAALVGVGGMTGHAALAALGAAAVAAVPLALAWGVGAARGLSVHRRLAPAWFAGRPARGAWVVRAGAWPALAVSVAEGDGDAPAELAALGAGREGEAPAAWTPSRRGRHALARIVVRTRAPFGLFTVTREIGAEAEITVAPRPRGGDDGRGVDDGARAARGIDPAGEFVGLRPWRPGDALHHVHWRTTARAGQLMVAVRAPPSRATRVVVVPPCRGEAFEAALERACGAILAAPPDEDVGLDLCGERLPPRPGDAWRRVLIDALALAPERP